VPSERLGQSGLTSADQPTDWLPQTARGWPPDRLSRLRLAGIYAPGALSRALPEHAGLRARAGERHPACHAGDVPVLAELLRASRHFLALWEPCSPCRYAAAIIAAFASMSQRDLRDNTGKPF